MAARGSIEPDSTQATRPSRSAAPSTSDAMPSPSSPLQTSQSGNIPAINTVDALDSREEKPSTWDEVYLLQEALKPSVRSFTRVTARSPPVVSNSHWLSYADQLAILQRESDRCWTADQRSGPPPKLAKLGAWGGGISFVAEAKFRITEEMTEEFMHSNFNQNPLPDEHGSLGWYHNTFNEQAHNEVERLLSVADARRERIKEQALDKEEPGASETITAILDSIVAQDPQRYLAWLSTMGYFYFTTYDHNPYGFSWEDWCTWKAPRSFQITCKPKAMVNWPPFGPGAIDKTKYGPPIERPIVSLEQAKKGNRRALAFDDTDDGLQVSQKERAEYHMIDGEATSRGAAAHYHAIRGEDVWLFDPKISFIGVDNDPGRKRETEVEASFCCP